MHEIQSGQILFDEDEALYVEPLVSLSSLHSGRDSEVESSQFR
jgi:hypothetical protein